MTKPSGARRLWRAIQAVLCGAVAAQAAGCMVDPDIILRATLSAGSDLAVFLLENAAASL